MSTFEKICLFYAVAGVLIGLMVSCMQKVNFRWRGRPMPCPRLFAGVASALVWPAVVFQLVIR